MIILSVVVDRTENMIILSVVDIVGTKHRT